MHRLYRPLARKEMRWGLSMLMIAALLVTSVASDQLIASLSRPYLQVIGASTLRFAETVPPLPPMSPHEAKVPSPVQEPPPAAITPVIAPPPPRAPEVIPPSPPVIAPAAPVEKKDPAPTNGAIPTLLPDDTRPDVRPEDFLPYFQMPGSSPHPGMLVVPAPGSMPGSSATYRQQ